MMSITEQEELKEHAWVTSVQQHCWVQVAVSLSFTKQEGMVHSRVSSARFIVLGGCALNDAPHVGFTLHEGMLWTCVHFMWHPYQGLGCEILWVVCVS